MIGDGAALRLQPGNRPTTGSLFLRPRRQPLAMPGDTPDVLRVRRVESPATAATSSTRSSKKPASTPTKARRHPPGTALAHTTGNSYRHSCACRGAAVFRTRVPDDGLTGSCACGARIRGIEGKKNTLDPDSQVASGNCRSRRIAGPPDHCPSEETNISVILSTVCWSSFFAIPLKLTRDVLVPSSHSIRGWVSTP